MKPNEIHIGDRVVANGQLDATVYEVTRLEAYDFGVNAKVREVGYPKAEYNINIGALQRPTPEQLAKLAN